MSKKHILARPIVSAALSLCVGASLIAGATYALLTDSDSINIAVTNALTDVKITATLSGTVDTYSNGVEQETGKFAGEGTATVNETYDGLTLAGVLPGDKAVATVTVTNYSTVAIDYKVTYTKSGEDGESNALSEALTVSAYDGSTETDYSQEQHWDAVSDSGSGETKTLYVAVELPESATLSEQLSAEITFTVTATQCVTEHSDDDTSAADYYASFTDEFTLDNQDGSWQYGYVTYTWANEEEGITEDFTFTQATEKNDDDDGDGWTASDGAVQIKASWIKAESMTTIAYTNSSESEITISAAVSFTGDTDETRLDLRVGVKDASGNLTGTISYDNNTSANTLSVTKSVTIAAGSTVYFIFSNGDSDNENATPSGTLSIVLTLAD